MTIATGDSTVNSRGEVVTFSEWMRACDQFLIDAGFDPSDFDADGYDEANENAMRLADEVFGINSGVGNE